MSDEKKAEKKSEAKKESFTQKRWFKVTKKVSIESAKILGGVAAGIGGLIAYQKFSGE